MFKRQAHDPQNLHPIELCEEKNDLITETLHTKISIFFIISPFGKGL